MIHFVLNAVIFDLAWLVNVMPAGQGLTWIGPMFSLCWLLFHMSTYPLKRLSDLRLCITAALIGYGADSLLVLSGLMAFPPHAQLGGPSTVWMVALWINLALTLNLSLVWLRNRYLLAALLGGIAGPLAYFAGTKLDAITLEAGYLPLIAIALLWMLAMPLLVWLAMLYNRYDNPAHYTGVTP